MSFYTSLEFYRPGPPPPVTAGDLGRFLARLLETESLRDSGLQTLRVKFGRAIDRDDQGTTWEEETCPGVAIVRGIEWDIEISKPDGVAKMAAALSGDRRTVYRAFASLGSVTKELLAAIERVNSPETRHGFCPGEFSVEIGPVEVMSLASEEAVRVGWISVGFSGHGYLYPWTLRDAVQRAEGSPAVRRITEACRSFWPVPSSKPDRAARGLRRKLGDLWPYENRGKPMDWFWGVAETG